MFTSRRGEISIGILVLVILSVAILAILLSWILGHVVPESRESVEGTQDKITGSSFSCENIGLINSSRCSEGDHCEISYNYTDFSTYSVKIPVSTVYWIDVEINRDCCWADKNDDPLDPKDFADNCTYNDPDIFNLYEYQPLVYEFRIGDTIGNYTIDPSLTDDGYENISIYLGPVKAGSHTLRWRIVSGWLDTPANCRGSDDPDTGGACSDPPDDCSCADSSDSQRIGLINSSRTRIRVYCEMI